MGKLKMDDFLRFIKEEYGITATLEKNAAPDSFEDIFGWDFEDKDGLDIKEDLSEEFGENLSYDTTSCDISLTLNFAEPDNDGISLRLAA